MPHWKSMTDRDYIFAFDLNGKDVTVTIAKVEAGQIASNGGRKAKKPIVYFEGTEKGFPLNSTNARTIASLYTPYTEKWLGQKITLFPTTTQMGGETVECIRVRPTIPGKKAKQSADELTDAIREEMQKNEAAKDAE